MTAAFAIAFDWFYADLTPEEKALMVQNIYEKGVLTSQGRKGWKTSAYNWNQVCAGGITMAKRSYRIKCMPAASSCTSY